MPKKTKKTHTPGTSLRMGGGIRPAKLVAPSLISRSIKRDAISSLVARSADARLVLFRAPAGFGKTMAMRQYFDLLKENGVVTAWLTLDALDDDFGRFIGHLIDAVQQMISPERDAAQQAVKELGKPNVDQLALDLMDLLANCEHRFALFIDQFESVSNRSIAEVLRLILSRLPPHGQVVIASHQTPSLQIGRLRAHGEFIEFDQSQLRFSLGETDVLLRTQCGLALTSDDVKNLYNITEGWPAALWLAATALEKQAHPESFIATFSGSNDAVTEYLAEDVLSKQPNDVQIFLLKTSILDELSKPLCDAVCQRNDSEIILNRLEDSNVFLTTLDTQKHLYRYHRLFADFLLSQLIRLYSREIPRLHLAAARWYEAEGRIVPAIEHALVSSDVEYALSLLVSCADSLLFQGRFRLLARWLDTLPSELLRTKIRLRITHIWALTVTRRSTEALKHLEALKNDGVTLDLTDELISEMDVLRPFILAMLDRHEEGAWLAGEALVKRPKQESFAFRILTTTLATWKVASNRYAEAISLLQGYRHREGGQKTSPTYYAICIEGLVDLLQGRVRQAAGHFRVALDEASSTFSSRSVGKAIAAVYLAEALYELDELNEAEQLLALYLPIVREYTLPDHVIISHVIQARIAYERGDVDHAFRRLSELEYIGRQENLPRVFASAQLERARISMLRDDLAEAQSHLERACDPDAWSGLRGMVMPANDVETVDLCRYRLYVRGVGKAELENALKADIKSAQVAQRNRRALKLSILYAKVLHTSGQGRLAMRSIENALQIACQEGLVRTFLDEGMPIIDLLREFRVAKQASSEMDQESHLFEFVDKILHRAGFNVDLEAQKDPAIDMAATFTSRELQILNSLSLGLSNVKIAENLFVTESTVRSHLRKINVKLGTGNRTQAVRVARGLGLIKG